jgi:hypothetical protein
MTYGIIMMILLLLLLLRRGSITILPIASVQPTGDA